MNAFPTAMTFEEIRGEIAAVYLCLRKWERKCEEARRQLLTVTVGLHLCSHRFWLLTKWIHLHTGTF